MTIECDNKGTFWRSPAGVLFGVFLGAALLVVLEHGTHILGASPLLVILAACVGMHGGHGSHGLTAGWSAMSALRSRGRMPRST